MASCLAPSEWGLAVTCFNKRHILAHKMGVIDQKYIDATGDSYAIVGRRISIKEEEIRKLVTLMQKLGTSLTREVSK